MSNTNPDRTTVRRTLLRGKKLVQAVPILTNVCSAGAQCPEVQASPIAVQALAALQADVNAVALSLTSKLSLVQALMTAIKALNQDYRAAKVSLATYETVVDAIAAGDGTVLNKAGLLSRSERSPRMPLGEISKLRSRLGKEQSESIVAWAAAASADTYALELNFTPTNPGGPWIPGGTTSRRTRVVKAPTPGAQFLARVAPVASDGTQGVWSDPILAVAR
jgi:hypothetical protein